MNVFFAALIANAALIVLSRIREYTSPVTIRSTDECCRELCKERMLLRLNNTIDYMEIDKRIPTIESSYSNMMVRLGTDLRFDTDQCPSTSYMLNRRQNFTPKHLNCPTLFLVGARKAGTSSLYQYISKHPDFEGTKLDAGPKVGETFYFSSLYKKKTWERYVSLFPPGGVMTGDSSVGNLVHPLAPRRLYESCGKQAKVVMLFRNPINRLESNFLMRSRLHKGRIENHTSISTIVKLQLDKFFEEALRVSVNVEDLPKKWSELVGLFRPSSNLVFEGLYYVHIMNWLCNFPAENILVLNSEEFYRNSSRILDIVFQFLDLKRLEPSTYEWITSVTYNQGGYAVPFYQRLSTADTMSLQGVYRPFNKALSRLLQWNIDQWNSLQ